jgi:GT2 family glycosyltransferase
MSLDTHHLPNPTIDIVILNYNTKDILAQCLPNVIKHSQIEGVNVVVADNCSTDGSADWVKSHYPQLELIRLDSNTGFAGGYNRALKNRTSEYIVLLNSDAEPSENWLEPLIQCAQNHPNFGAAQPLIIDYFQRDKFEYAGAAGGFMDVFGFPFCRGRIFGNVELNQSQYTETLPVFWASGAALFIKRSCWEEAQGLDEAFFAHMEEIDLCWRLKTMNYEIYACPQSSVFHMGGATLSTQNPRKTYLNFRNGLLMLHKNLPDSIREKRILERKLFDGLAGVFFLLQGKPKHMLQIIKAHRYFDKNRHHFPRNPKPKELTEMTGILHHSLVLGYFFQGKKTWANWFK